jgi:hypothetical protein
VTIVSFPQLTTAELNKGREAAAYLRHLPAALDQLLVIKLDTLHADLTAEIEDRATSGGDTGWAPSIPLQ